MWPAIMWMKFWFPSTLWMITCVIIILTTNDGIEMISMKNLCAVFHQLPPSSFRPVFFNDSLDAFFGGKKSQRKEGGRRNTKFYVALTFILTDSTTGAEGIIILMLMWSSSWNTQSWIKTSVSERISKSSFQGTTLIMLIQSIISI